MQTEFDKIAKDYEAWHSEVVSASGFSVEYFQEYKVKEIRRILKKYNIESPISILDFGCGIGNADPYIRKHFPESQICGVDVSGESIKIAKEKQKDYNIRYEILDSKLLGRESTAQFEILFDFVFVFNVFHHVPKSEHMAILSYIKANMKPNGLLFIFEFNPYNPASRYIFNKFDRPVDKNANLIYPYYLKNKIKDSSFRPILCNYTVFFPKPLEKLILLEKYMTWLPMGAHYYLMAEKLS